LISEKKLKGVIMKFPRRSFLQMALGASALSAVSRIGFAQAYPSRPARIVVGFAAGGATDIQARLVGQWLSERLGQQFIVENRAGASGNIATEAVIKAPPDGYTLLQIVTPHAINAALFTDLNFDFKRDITPVICTARLAYVVVVHPSVPAKTMPEFIAYAKANPGKFTYGSTGNGTTPHLAFAEFASKAKIDVTHVPFKGSADGLQAVLGGHVMSHSDATGWAPQVEAGTMRLLATYGSKRTKRWPNVPTLNELGYDTVSDSPFGIGGPKGMDPAVVKKLHDAFKKTLEDPAVMASFDKYDQSVIYMGTEEYTQFIRNTFQSEKATIERLGLAMKT
jgi:tripartite-type tricarboxylate transporter receptor subunit TctC